MTIWAIFICATAFHRCDMDGPYTYRSATECHRWAKALERNMGRNGIRITCLSRHVETWQ